MDDSNLTPRERERLQKTLNALPDDIHTGLEIGFDEFRLTYLLRRKFDLVSVDLPGKVNSHHGYKIAFANIQHLPFRNSAFDIVVCTEVLEHLPENVLLKGVKELQRVSRKYVLVSVPYKQRVWNEMFKCANCGFVCNSMGHVRYMDDRQLSELFDKASTEKVDLVGAVNGYAPDRLYALANRFGDVWCDYQWGNCPSCKQSNQGTKPNPLGYILQRLIWRAEGLAKTRPAWIIALFKVTA